VDNYRKTRLAYNYLSLLHQPLEPLYAPAEKSSTSQKARKFVWINHTFLGITLWIENRHIHRERAIVDKLSPCFGDNF